VRHFYGKYRGKVEQNQDPLQMGRVQVSCPAVLGRGRMSWAMPCVPYAGPGVGLFAIPPTEAHVWVEFEGGDANKPIWSGCFWATAADVPAKPALPSTKVLKTDSVMLKLDDLPGVGGFTLEVKPSPTMTVTVAATTAGLKLSAGLKSEVMLGTADVAINGDALKVI
jgi:hypothetical protein